MTQELPANETPARPDIDENGVDRAQIREMLELTPIERLRRMQDFVNAVRRIRAVNGIEEPSAR